MGLQAGDQGYYNLRLERRILGVGGGELMFGMMEALLSFLRRQVGLRTDSASCKRELTCKSSKSPHKHISIYLEQIKHKVNTARHIGNVRGRG